MSLKLFLAFFLVFPVVCYSQWTSQSSPTTHTINDIHFLTENIGFLGTNNSVYKTVDGGSTWTSPEYSGTLDLQLLSSAYIYDIHFFDQLNGLIAGSGFFNNYDIVAKTADGGATWHLVYYQAVAGGASRTPLTSILFLDNNIGFVAGGGGKILKTIDGGNSWVSVSSPTTNNIKKILFVNSQTGFIAGEKMLLKTTDGGISWQAILSTFNISDLHFFTATKGMATTLEGTILETLDGGEKWTAYPMNFNAMLGKITFQNQTGYVVGFDGMLNKFILRTTDGGNIWEHQFPEASNNLSGIAIAPGGKVWTGGWYGKLFTSTNEGGPGYPIASFTASSNVFCENLNYTFRNNGPENKYTYEWWVDDVLKSNNYNFSTTFNAGNHKVELIALNGQFKGKSKISFYADPSVNFSRPLVLEFGNGICSGNGTTIEVKNPEYGNYKLYQGTTLLATDDDYYPAVLLKTPALQATTSFSITATRSNSCETAEIHRDTVVTVYTDLREGSAIHPVQDYFCNEGQPAVQITSSKPYVVYDLYNDNRIVSTAKGNGQMITVSSSVIQDTSSFKVKASVVGGVCVQWFDEIVRINVEKVKADFYLSTMNAASTGEAVNVYNKSSGAAHFQWTFNDASPQAANVSSPGPVRFHQPGTSQAVLQATSGTGCTDIETKLISVYDDSFLKHSCWATGTKIGSVADGHSIPRQSYGIAVAPDGDIVTTGVFLGQAEFDSKAGRDYTTPQEEFITHYLARYSTKGVLKWFFNISQYYVENSANLKMSQVTVAPDGAIYLLTKYGSFDPVFYSANGDTLRPYSDVFIYPAGQQYVIKYTPDGMLQWVRSKAEITGDMLSTEFIDMEIDQSGNVYVVNDYFYKLSPQGEIVTSVKVFDFPPDVQNADFALSPDGSLYCLNYPDGQHILIKKYSAGGHLERESIINGANYCIFTSAGVDPDNNLILLGLAFGEVHFQSTDEDDYILDSNAAFIVKYDPLGKIRWLNATLSDIQIQGEAITIDEDGQTSLAMRTFHPNGVLQSQDGNNFEFTIPSSYLVTYDKEGNIQSTNRILSDNDGLTATITNLASTMSQVYAIGHVFGDYDEISGLGIPATVNGDAIYSGASSTLFIAKFERDCSMITPALTGNIEDLMPETPICSGTVFHVAYAVDPSVLLEQDNVFSIFLSNENGEFRIPTRIGTLASANNQGVIQAVIPGNISSGGNYRIRLWASDPKLYSIPLEGQFSIKSAFQFDFTYSSGADLVINFNPSGDEAMDHQWTMEGKTLQEVSPVYKFSTTGLSNVCLTARNTCDTEKTVCKDVVVTCAPVLTDFTYTIDDKTVTFKGVTDPSNKFRWDFGDANTAATLNVQHTYPTYGEKYVCFRSATECNEGTACKTIMLNCVQAPLAFSFTSAEKTVQFINNSPSEYTSFEWRFGDGIIATGKNVSHTYSEPGTYIVTLKSSGKCALQKEISQSVTVICSVPSASFQVTVDNLDVYLANTSLNATEQHWDFGDGTTGNGTVSAQHHYLVSGDYQICLAVKNNCTQKILCKTVTVLYPLPAAPTNLSTSTSGLSSIALQWNDNSTAEQSFRIEYKEVGTTLFQTAAVVSANSMQYTVNNLQCNRSYTFRVLAIGEGSTVSYSNEATASTIKPKKPLITQSALQGCEGQHLNLEAPGGFAGYLWSTGATTQKISVSSSGQYAVRVTDYGNCQSDFSDKSDIIFYPLPEEAVEVANGEIRSLAVAAQYQWYLNDSPLEGSTAQTILPKANGNYKVEVTNKGCSTISQNVLFLVTGLEETEDDQIKVYPLPANDKLTIGFGEAAYRNAATVTLISVIGNNSFQATKPRNEKKIEMDISRLSAGIYICLIEMPGEIVYKKISIY